MRTIFGLLSIFFMLSCYVNANEPEFTPELIPRNIHQIPEGFPSYRVPGYESELNTVRQMFFHHYLFFPGATYNDVYIMMSLAWADTGADSRYNDFRKGMKKLLSNRVMASDGHVSCMQHIGLAHPDGWPFPLWIQSEGVGFHFSNDDVWIWEACGTKQTTTLDGWDVDGVNVDKIEPVKGLHVQLTNDHASFTTPAFKVKGIVAPFMVLHWWPKDIPAEAVFFLEWTTEKHPAFKPEHRTYFSVEKSNEDIAQTPVPLYPALSLDDTLTQVRLNIKNAKGMKLSLERLFTAVDTRHQCNNFVWFQGCNDYLKWTGDLDFLRSQINRWRLALRYAIDEFRIEKDKCVNIPWPNHDGRPGVDYDKDGKRIAHYGQGLGGTYFDIIPCGGKDAYTTLFMYDTLKRMADLEEQIAGHPQWNIPAGPLRFDPKYLRGLAKNVRKTSQKIFWNSKTKRFVPGIDRDGKTHDYGFLYYNLESVYYGIPTKKQSRQVYDWITGKRFVKGDTTHGNDIYHWRFAPRTTTRRNLSYYGYSWDPKIFKWGDQVQDGGGVLAWSYYDLMNRIKIYGPDNAWQRLQEIIAWFDEVQAEGGYREYYKKLGRGRLQGGNVAGGLGLDCEFLENIMLSQVMIYGFMGLQPGLTGIDINPSLPSDWPQLTITSIRWQSNLMDITVTSDNVIKVKVREGNADDIIKAIHSSKCKVELIE